MQRRFLGLAIGFLLVPMVFLVLGIVAQSEGLYVVAGLMFLVFAPFCIYLVRCARHPQMTLSNSGIDFRGVLGRSLHVPWDEVERISPMPGHEGLVLRNPLDTKAARRLAGTAGFRYNGAPMYLPEEEQLIAQCRWIPFKYFAGWLQDGGLVTDLISFVPEVAAAYTAAAPEIQKQRQTNRKVIWWIILVTLALTIPAGLFGAFGEQWTANYTNELNQIFSVANKVVMILLICLLGLSSIVNFRASWLRLKSKSFGFAVLWFVTACVQVLLTLVCFGELFTNR